MEEEKKVVPGVFMADFIEFLRKHKAMGQHNLPAQVKSETSAISREVGVLYEKLRFALDNKEEHFFRRYAVRRALRRVSLFSNDPERLLSILIADLIRGGYLASGELTDVQQEEAKQSLRTFTRMQTLLRNAHESSSYHEYRAFLLDIVAGAIEDAWYDNSREEGLVVMLARTAEKVFEGEELLEQDEEKRRIIFYITSWRSLFTADASLLRYKLWLIVCPGWDQLDDAGLARVVNRFPKISLQINHLISHPLGVSILPKIHDLSIAHTLLYDMVSTYGSGIETIIAEKKLLESHIRECIEERYRGDIERAQHRSFRAIMYIFATKSIMAVGVESLYVFVFKQSLNYIAIAINIVAHPALLFFLTGGVRKPDARNTTRAVLLTSAIVYDTPIPSIFLKKEHRGIVTDIALGLYTAFLGASIVGIIWGLNTLQFHSVDIFIFLLFLLLVLYFGFRIRSSALRMRFSNTREGFLRTFFELLLLPLISLGRWMSLRFEKLNIVVLFLDFFIEVPLRLILRFLDIFTRLVERKRDEIYTP